MTSPTAPFEVASSKGSHRLLTGLVVILGGVILVMVFFSHRSLYQIFRSHQEELRMDQENARLAGRTPAWPAPSTACRMIRK